MGPENWGIYKNKCHIPSGKKRYNATSYNVIPVGIEKMYFSNKPPDLHHVPNWKHAEKCKRCHGLMLEDTGMTRYLCKGKLLKKENRWNGGFPVAHTRDY